MKDEQNCSYNNGGDAYLLKIWSDFSSIQYTKSLTLCVTQFFLEFLKLAEGGGHFYICKKQCTLRYLRRDDMGMPRKCAP